MMQSLCPWCEGKRGKKPKHPTHCSEQCARDEEDNLWPSWMTGRIGLEHPEGFHVTGDYLCLSAPNRYRRIFRSRSGTQEDIIGLQRDEYPHLSEPAGLGIDLPTWDQVLMWPAAPNAEKVGVRRNDDA